MPVVVDASDPSRAGGCSRRRSPAEIVGRSYGNVWQPSPPSEHPRHPAGTDSGSIQRIAPGLHHREPSFAEPTPGKDGAAPDRDRSREAACMTRHVESCPHLGAVRRRRTERSRALRHFAGCVRVSGRSRQHHNCSSSTPFVIPKPRAERLIGNNCDFEPAHTANGWLDRVQADEDVRPFGVAAAKCGQP